MAFLAATRKSITISGISSVSSLGGGPSNPTTCIVNNLGTNENGTMTTGLLNEPKMKQPAAGVAGEWLRPVCQSWQKKRAPLACTASTTGFHASTWSSLQSPGTRGYPAAVSDTALASAMRRTPGRPLLVVEGVVRLRQVLQRPAARHRRKNNPATTNTIRTKKIKHG